MSKNFDSISEETAAPVFAGCNYYKTDASLPFNCYDYDNVRHYGKADFSCSLDGDWPLVEYKAGPLNTIRTKKVSEKSEARAKQRRAKGYGNATDRSIQLETGYNHSVYKLAEAQAKAPPLGYIIVFKDAPTLIEAELYLKHGLIYCTLSSFGMFLNLVMAVKRSGLNFSYTQYTSDGQEITISLGGMYHKQVHDQKKRDASKPAKGLAIKPCIFSGAPLEAVSKGQGGAMFNLPKENSKIGKVFYKRMAELRELMPHQAT